CLEVYRMRLSATILGFAAAACLTLSPVLADSHGSKPTAPGKPTVSSKPTSGKPAKSTSGKPATSKKSGTGSTSTNSGSDSTTTGSTTTGSGSTTTETKLNPIAAKIASKPNLSSKVSGMLPIDPATGKTMTLDKASLGFKNQGQFIAAL